MRKAKMWDSLKLNNMVLTLCRQKSSGYLVADQLLCLAFPQTVGIVVVLEASMANTIKAKN